MYLRRAHPNLGVKNRIALAYEVLYRLSRLTASAPALPGRPSAVSRAAPSATNGHPGTLGAHRHPLDPAYGGHFLAPELTPGLELQTDNPCIQRHVPGSADSLSTFLPTGKNIPTGIFFQLWMLWELHNEADKALSGSRTTTRQVACRPHVIRPLTERTFPA